MSDVNQRIYAEKKAVVGVVIGGSLAGAYYFCRNFRALGMSTRAVISPIVGALFLIVTIGTMLVPPLDRIPDVIFWSLQIGLTYGLYRGYLAAPIEEHLTKGNAEFGWGNTITVAIVSLILTLGIIFAVLYFAGALNGQSVKYFGALQHEIAYDDNNIAPDEVDRIGSALTRAGFFDQAVKKTADATKDGDSLILNMYCLKSSRNSEFIELVRTLREDVQQSFPRNPIIIDLVIETPDNRIARIE